MTKLLGSLLVLGASVWGMTLQLRERGRRRRTRLDLLDALRQTKAAGFRNDPMEYDYFLFFL